MPTAAAPATTHARPRPLRGRRGRPHQSSTHHSHSECVSTYEIDQEGSGVSILRKRPRRVQPGRSRNTYALHPPHRVLVRAGSIPWPRILTHSSTQTQTNRHNASHHDDDGRGGGAGGAAGGGRHGGGLHAAPPDDGDGREAEPQLRQARRRVRGWRALLGIGWFGDWCGLAVRSMV